MFAKSKGIKQSPLLSRWLSGQSKLDCSWNYLNQRSTRGTSSALSEIIKNLNSFYLQSKRETNAQKSAGKCHSVQYTVCVYMWVLWKWMYFYDKWLLKMSQPYQRNKQTISLLTVVTHLSVTRSAAKTRVLASSLSIAMSGVGGLWSLLRPRLTAVWTKKASREASREPGRH